MATQNFTEGKASRGRVIQNRDRKVRDRVQEEARHARIAFKQQRSNVVNPDDGDDGQEWDDGYHSKADLGDYYSPEPTRAQLDREREAMEEAYLYDMYCADDYGQGE